MKVIKLIVLAILVSLSLAAGAAKIMQVPQELAFFEAVGVPTAFLLPFGVVQAVAAVLAIRPKTRKLGLRIMAFVFLISAWMILVGGNLLFSLISLIPAGLAASLSFEGLRRSD